MYREKTLPWASVFILYIATSFENHLHIKRANLQVTPNQADGCGEPTHTNDSADENYINKNNRLWKRERWQTKHFPKTKRTVTLVFLSSIWPAGDAWQHMKTSNFNGKNQTCQWLWQNSIISKGSLKTLIFLFQPLPSKFWELSQNFRFSRIPLQGVLNIVGAWKNLAWIWSSAEKLSCQFMPLPASEIRSILWNRPNLSGIQIEKLKGLLKSTKQFHNMARSDFMIPRSKYFQDGEAIWAAGYLSSLLVCWAEQTAGNSPNTGKA